MSRIQQMQNELFKATFGRPEHAAGYLRSVLPADTVEALDWSTLAACPGSFLDPPLADRGVDALFSVAVRTGGDALIYLVYQNRGAVDDLVGFRMLQCQVRIWERWLVEHDGAGRLPVIIPVLMCSGAEQLPSSLAVGPAN